MITLAPVVMFFLDLPAALLGIDRMNEIDRVTPVTLWISLGYGLVAGAGLIWSRANKWKNQTLDLKQWFATLAWGPLSAFIVGWTLNGWRRSFRARQE